MANKDKREQARAERVAAEAQADAQARRRKLIGYSSAAVLLAGVLIAALIAISQSSDDSGGGGGTDIQSVDEVDKQLNGIPQNGTVLGDPNAKVTITEYGDLQCPVCASFSNDVAPTVIEGPVAGGDANFELHQWTIIGPDSIPAAKAAYAAGEQDRYWNFVELFYRNQGAENSGYVTDDFLTALAEAAGVEDIEQWQQDRKDPAWDKQLKATDAEANSLGLQGTPSIIVHGPGGTKQLPGVPTADQVQAAVSAVG